MLFALASPYGLLTPNFPGVTFITRVLRVKFLQIRCSKYRKKYRLCRKPAQIVDIQLFQVRTYRRLQLWLIFF